MRAWIAGVFMLVSVGFVLPAVAVPIKTRPALPAPRVPSPMATEGYCPAWPGGSGILPDGDFSGAPEPNGGDEYGLQKGEVFAPDWVVTGPKNIDFYGLNAQWLAPNGVCSVDLDGTPGRGGMRHNAFPTTRGATYTVTFEFSANGGGQPTVKTLFVRSGEQRTSFTWDTSGGNCAQNGDWKTETWQFRATATTSMLHFESGDRHAGYWGPVVAAVSVTQNPGHPITGRSVL
jgi:hypothetical protein